MGRADRRGAERRVYWPVRSSRGWRSASCSPPRRGLVSGPPPWPVRRPCRLPTLWRIWCCAKARRGPHPRHRMTPGRVRRARACAVGVSRAACCTISAGAVGDCGNAAPLKQQLRWSNICAYQLCDNRKVHSANRRRKKSHRPGALHSRPTTKRPAPRPPRAESASARSNPQYRLRSGKEAFPGVIAVFTGEDLPVGGPESLSQESSSAGGRSGAFRLENRSPW